MFYEDAVKKMEISLKDLKDFEKKIITLKQFGLISAEELYEMLKRKKMCYKILTRKYEFHKKKLKFKNNDFVEKL